MAGNFWRTQPAWTQGEGSGPLWSTAQFEIPAASLALPEGMAWWSPDPREDGALGAVHAWLTEHYPSVPSLPALRWRWTAPDQPVGWLAAVRRGEELLGFVAATPLSLSLRGELLHVAHIDFLCVCPAARGTGLAPLLIREITRRVNLTGRWQALYTSAFQSTSPLVSARVCHRPLDPQALADLGLPRASGALPEAPLSRLRPMTPGDVPAVHVLLARDAGRRALAALRDLDATAHAFLPREGVVDTFVADGPRGVTDLTRFTQSIEPVAGDVWRRSLRVAHGAGLLSTRVPPRVLLHDTLALARRQGLHLFRAVETGPLVGLLDPLQFDPGPTQACLFLYNWRCPALAAEEVGLL